MHRKHHRPSKKRLAKAEKPLEIDEDEAEINFLLHNVTLTCDVVKPNHRLLTKTRFLPADKYPLQNMIQRLAFVYRFHLFVLGTALLTKSGGDRDKFYTVRSQLIHRVNINLLDEKILAHSSQLLQHINLDELNLLNATYRQLNGKEIFSGLKKLPIYKAIFAEKDHDDLDVPPGQCESWLKETIIPLLNYIRDKTKKLEYTEKSEFYDATKMLIMIVGDCCRLQIKPGFFDHHAYHHFMAECRKLRGDYSHKALTHKLYERNEELMRLGRKITTVKLEDHANINETLFPFTCHPKQTEAQIDTRHSRPAAAP